MSTTNNLICKNCKYLGEEIHEDWMTHEEHYHKCYFADSVIGLIEEQDSACGLFKNKESL